MVIETDDIPINIIDQALMAQAVVDDGCKEEGLTTQQTMLVRLGASLMLGYVRENGLPKLTKGIFDA